MLSVMKSEDPDIEMTMTESEFLVSSLQIAEHFEKRHDNVLRVIEDLEVPDDFRLLNFKESNYLNSQNKKMPRVLLTRDGFVFLAMGFTGSKATEWKLRYLRAFNAMEAHILKSQEGKEWALMRAHTKLFRLPLTDAIQKFVQYAVDQGSESYKKNPALAYINFTKMEYKDLFMISKSVPNLRDQLSVMSLQTLGTAEMIVKHALSEEMEKGTHYKEIFQVCKRKVEGLSKAVGAEKNLAGNPFKKGLTLC